MRGAGGAAFRPGAGVARLSKKAAKDCVGSHHGRLQYWLTGEID
ncbi:MAG: hypothetical protein PVF40_09640 [Ectothiorhodospiraceae bacterium]|jgi:hypothetical protein